jgi:sugar lactone lactonase YvrE
VAHNGNVYVTGPARATGGGPGLLWLVQPGGEVRVVDPSAGRDVAGITLSADQSMLFAADGASHWVARYAIRPDGTLESRQNYVRLHAGESDGRAGDASRSAGGICADREGRLYVATDLGIQITGQAALVNAILPTPERKAADLCFGGPEFDTIYALCGDKVFRRRLKVRGANAWDPPVLATEKP